MDYKEKIKSKTEKLVDAVKEVENSGLSKAEQSREIMTLLRKEYVWAKNDYINKFYESPKVTINPESPDVKPEKEEGDKKEIKTDEYTKIYAYSFGPWNTNNKDDYFDEDTLRIVWLLKEPLLEDINQMKGRIEGINQVSSKEDGFPTWQDVVDEDPKKKGTKAKLIMDTQKLLDTLSGMEVSEIDQIQDEKLRKQIKKLQGENLNYDKNNASEKEEAVMNKVMNHICILEVNHFPGLAFSGSDSEDNTIGKWADINAELLKLLISFYSPKIIIGGNTIGHFFTGCAKSKHDIISLKKSVDNGNKLLITLGLEVSDIVKPEESSSYIIKAKYNIESMPVYIIHAYHPCPKRNKDYEYTLKDAEADAKQIKSWISK